MATKRRPAPRRNPKEWKHYIVETKGYYGWETVPNGVFRSKTEAEKALRDLARVFKAPRSDFRIVVIRHR